jgi:hypothetical protein
VVFAGKMGSELVITNLENKCEIMCVVLCFFSLYREKWLIKKLKTKEE